jgi:toxin FitB
MKLLFDTCVISEPKQEQPNEKVMGWLNTQDESRIFLSVLTIGEIKKGITRLDSGKKKLELEGWIDECLVRFSNRILSLTTNTFLIWGRLAGEFEKNGIVRPSLDSLLEATALEHDLILVTRNVKNFGQSQVTILNPWED